MPARLAVEEVRQSGDLGGAATYALLHTAFASAARRVPGGLVTDDGSPEGVADSFHRFLMAKLKALPAELRLKNTDDEISKLVFSVAHRWLQDRARSKTDHGSHRHTLERVMRADDAFHQRLGSPTLWGLAGAGTEFSGEASTLHRAAAGVTGIRPGRRGNDEQRPSLAPAADLARLLIAVLGAANGYVSIAELTHVVEYRLRAFAPRVEFLDAEEGSEQHRPGLRRQALDALVTSDLDPGTVEASRQLVAALWEAMSERERHIVTMLGDIPAIQARLGIGKSQAHVISGRLEARLEHIDGTDVDPELVLELLTDLAEQAQGRTEARSVRHAPAGEAPRAPSRRENLDDHLPTIRTDAEGATGV